jgi:hypothetical protein
MVHTIISVETGESSSTPVQAKLAGDCLKNKLKTKGMGAGGPSGRHEALNSIPSTTHILLSLSLSLFSPLSLTHTHIHTHTQSPASLNEK